MPKEFITLIRVLSINGTENPVKLSSFLDTSHNDQRTTSPRWRLHARMTPCRRCSSYPKLDERSLNINTFNPNYVLMGHALPEEAQSPAVHRGRTEQAGIDSQVSN